jgi:hypothetical protein
MTNRVWTFVGVFAVLGLAYITFFTEWLRPEPIEIASQIRPAVQPPRFGRVVMPTAKPGQPAQTNKIVLRDQIERIGRPEKGVIDQAPGGVANVTFSLDGMYHLTAIRVEDVPADGTKPKILWQLKGKSRPAASLLYGRVPEGMTPVVPGAAAEPLQAGVPYRLFLEAGRRRGSKNFTTVPATVNSAQ